MLGDEPACRHDASSIDLGPHFGIGGELGPHLPQQLCEPMLERRGLSPCARREQDARGWRGSVSSRSIDERASRSIPSDVKPTSSGTNVLEKQRGGSGGLLHEVCIGAIEIEQRRQFGANFFRIAAIVWGLFNASCAAAMMSSSSR